MTDHRSTQHPSTGRRTMPSKARIAVYWIQQDHQFGNAPFGGFDWFEPACWACGVWNPAWDGYWDVPAPSGVVPRNRCLKHCSRMLLAPRLIKGRPSDDRYSATYLAVWNHTPGLERCHLTPRYKDPLLRDSADRLVLMCSLCHATQPDFDTDVEAFDWMRSQSLTNIRADKQ
jgi:hypothetical protein